MHEFVSLNCRITPHSEANISAISASVLHGKGVFTTLAIRDSTPFLWEKHWIRLNNHAQRLYIDTSGFEESAVLKSLKELLDLNQVSNARCRLSFFDGGSSPVWPSGINSNAILLIQTADPKEIKQNTRITISSIIVNSTSPLAGIKSVNYLDNILALKEAEKQQFDEAIRINQRNEVVSACMANVFWLKGKTLFTPSLKTGCLAGTIRAFLLERRQIFEVEKGVESLEDADLIFLTSSGIGIVQVGSLNEIEFATELDEFVGMIDGSR